MSKTTDWRDKRGRFIKGNPGWPGRPRKQYITWTPEEERLILLALQEERKTNQTGAEVPPKSTPRH